MLQLIALTRPQSERLVEEAIKWVHSSHAIERELDTLRAPTSKKGSQVSRRTAGQVLALLAGLDVDSLESEFMQASVPHQLIYMNARMSCTHPGVVDYWMRWATRQAQEAELKESTMSASEAAALYTAGGAVDFPVR